MLAIALTVTAIGAMAYSSYARIANSLTPRLDALNSLDQFQTSRIYDRNGEVLYEFFDAGKRTHVDYADISPLLIQATVAIEDKTFFTNAGVDPEGIMRVILGYLQTGEEIGGASTITQQVIKNIILSDEERLYENRYQRKIKEIILAQELGDHYDKEQIIELYLNEIFYGNLAYGIEAASNVYFDATAKRLTLAQASLLAGLPQLPTRYNPINYLVRDDQGGYLPGLQLGDGWLDPDYVLPADITPPKWRQIAVLRQMVDEGYVTEERARAAVAQNLRFAPQDVPLNAPHFVFYVRDLLEERYGQTLLTRGGLNIYTTLDLSLQRMIQQKAAEHIAKLEQRNIHNAAVVAMQPNTGQILAMVGSIDYNAVAPTNTPGESGNVLDGQVNVTTRERQPGSALKPFTYLAAMEKGMTPATVLWDAPTQFPSGSGGWYAPLNYNGRWNGPVRIRTALANSLNMPAVKALKFAGVQYTLGLLDRVGIKTGLKRGEGFYGLSLTLGGGEVTPLELTTAYNTLASGGRYFPPVAILKIVDGQGDVLEEFQPSIGQQVVDPSLVDVITDMMSDDRARAAIWGMNSKLKLSQPVAVKTGTSNDWRDAWTLGFTPYVTIGVWSGNNNNEPTERVESLEGGGIIWHNVMEEIFVWIDAQPDYKQLFSAPFGGSLPTEFTIPDDNSIVRKPICPLPGSFGGYSQELFTTDMLSRTAALTPTFTSSFSSTLSLLRSNSASGAATQERVICDAYIKLDVIRVPEKTFDGRLEVSQPLTTTGALEPDVQFCLPVAGEEYPPELRQTVYIWNTPPPDPSERVQYRWSWGSAEGGIALHDDQTIVSIPPGNLQLCTADMFKPMPPAPGAILMPDLERLGENQAKEVLAVLGITNIYVDYQDRSRIPDIYDDYLPYTVVSTLPRADEWIFPGASVILGIRAPDPEPDVPESSPTPAPPDPGDPPPPQATPLPLPPSFETNPEDS